MSHVKKSLIFCMLLAILPTVAFASTFQIWLDSANSIGYGHADMAALADDASTAFYNPAGMTRINRYEVSTGFTFVDIHNQFRSRLDTNNNPIVNLIEELLIGTTFQPSRIYLPRSEGGFRDTVPNFHLVAPISCAPWDLTFGFSVTAPWALETNYKYSVVSGYADKTRLLCINYNPSIAIKPFKGLSIGAGYDLQQLDTYYSSSILLLGVESKFESWKSTWNVGVLYEFDECTRIGATYRPQVHHHQSGRSKFLNENVKAKSSIVLPATVTLGAFHQLTNRAAVMATAAYTWWNKVKRVTVNSDFPVFDFALLGILGGGIPFHIDASTVNVPLHWHNSYFIAVGGNYQVTDQWLLKAGLAFDKTPTRARHRELRVSDQSRYHLALGARYCFNEDWQFDFGYQYIYLPTVKIRHNPFLVIDVLGQNGIPGPLELTGKTKSQANIIAGQLTWKFGCPRQPSCCY